MTPKIPKKINNDQKRTAIAIERSAQMATKWIGSTKSLIFHSVIFIFFFFLIILGFKANTVMLILTTIVSLEAIYLSIFIQMSVNHHANRLDEVSEDIEDIQEDVDEIQKDVEEISEDIEDIQEDVDEIQKDVEEISDDVEEISDDMDEDDKNDEARDKEMLTKIEGALNVIMQEIAILKTHNKANSVEPKPKTNTIKELTAVTKKKK